MKMDEKERVEVDIEKLRRALKRAKELFPEEKELLDWAENYLNDSIFYYKKGDYFTSFGCVNYAYGLLDGLFIIKGVKEKLYEEEGI